MLLFSENFFKICYKHKFLIESLGSGREVSQNQERFFSPLFSYFTSAILSLFLVLPDFTGTNISLFSWEFGDSINFRSQFLKFGAMDNYSNGFQRVLFNLMAKTTYIRTA